MASSIVLRRATAQTLFAKLLHPLRSSSVAPSVARSFNTNAQIKNYADDDDQSIDVVRRSDRPVSRRDSGSVLFPETDAFDLFSPPRSLSQVLNIMDQIMDNPFITSPRGTGAASRRSWDVKEDKEALYIRMDMPGLGKDDVKVSVEQSTLIIKGEGDKESEDEEGGRKYSTRIDLPVKGYKLDEIKAEMKNGVLRVLVPKVKEDERDDVFQVKID